MCFSGDPQGWFINVLCYVIVFDKGTHPFSSINALPKDVYIPAESGLFKSLGYMPNPLQYVVFSWNVKRFRCLFSTACSLIEGKRD